MTFSNTNFSHIHNFKIIEVYNAWWTEKSLSPGVNVIDQRNTLNLTL